MAVLVGVLHMVQSKRLVPKEVVAAQVVAEFLQEAEDVGDAVYCRQVQSVLLPIKHRWRQKQAELNT